MGPFEMVVAIVIVVTIGQVIRHKHGRRGGGDAAGSVAATTENRRLHDEVRALKDRVQVLERVITDNESGLRLDHEIERLRDKNRV